MSSKFSSPFFKKSPLLGAYTSGADGMVTVSDAKYFAKLQSDLGVAADKYFNNKNKEYFDTSSDNFLQSIDDEETAANEVFGNVPKLGSDDYAEPIKIEDVVVEEFDLGEDDLGEDDI